MFPVGFWLFIVNKAFNIVIGDVKIESFFPWGKRVLVFALD